MSCAIEIIVGYLYQQKQTIKQNIMTTVNVNKDNAVTINADAGVVRYQNQRELVEYIFTLKNGIAFALKQQFAARTNADFDRLDSERRQYEKVLAFLQRIHDLRF